VFTLYNFGICGLPVLHSVWTGDSIHDGKVVRSSSLQFAPSAAEIQNASAIIYPPTGIPEQVID
jgi:hypothetical protein